MFFFSFQNNPKGPESELDLSYKTDLNLWDCFWLEKEIL